MQKFEHRRADYTAPESRLHLDEYIFGEVDQQSVIYVGGEPLAEYAAGRIDKLAIEPGDEE